jgi:plasmid stability protein
MPSLQVRELPDNIYYSLQKKAQAEHRSLAQEAVIVLAKGLNTSVSNKNRRKELLQTFADNQAVMQIDPVELIREDRLR